MRVVSWLFVVSAALFVGGIAFVVAAARMAPEPARVSATAAASAAAPVASIKQVMNGIVAPAAAIVFASVGTILTADGIEERAPKTDEEWTAVGSSAAALIEAGRLLMVEGRAIDGGDWMKMSEAMINASRIALAAIEAKTPDGVLASGEALNESCDVCHQRYQR